MRIIHSRVQHGVGQGSFHSASIEVYLQDAGPRPQFRYDYVYDCGALVAGRLSAALLRSIKRLDLSPRKGEASRGVIDAVVLSHYDRDHIIGTQLLVARFKVKRIIVPHLTPNELMLVLASQPGALDSEQIGELHRLATGSGDGNLFGVPVTQIMPGSGPDDDPGDNDPERTQPLNDLVDADQQAQFGLPESLVPVDAATGAPLGATLPAGGALRATVPHSSQWSPWRFKFWNRGLSDELMEQMFVALWGCGFPLHALHDADALPELVDWLEDANHRKATLAAYEQAIEAYKPDWAKEAEGKRLANFLSLAMYSGPANEGAEDVWLSSGSWLDRFDRWSWRWRAPVDRRTGWLGTGDAPLGETDVWADFARHYRRELNHVLTVQVPHHGAAPKTGPKFFNPALLPTEGMRAMVSAGTYNTYGHPAPQVIKEVLAAQADLEIVTEESWLGCQEIVTYRHR